jgi:hypothetical protein
MMSGVAVSLAFRPIDSGIHWIAEESAGLKITPNELTASEVVALVILGPLVLGALFQFVSNGLGRTLARFLSFWLAGLKSGIVGLLLFLPGLAVLQVHVFPARWLRIVLMALLYIFAPFWALLLIRHLPAAVLRGTLFERFRPENFDSGSGAMERP